MHKNKFPNASQDSVDNATELLQCLYKLVHEGLAVLPHGVVLLQLKLSTGESVVGVPFKNIVLPPRSRQKPTIGLLCGCHTGLVVEPSIWLSSFWHSYGFPEVYFRIVYPMPLEMHLSKLRGTATLENIGVTDSARLINIDTCSISPKSFATHLNISWERIFLETWKSSCERSLPYVSPDLASPGHRSLCTTTSYLPHPLVVALRLQKSPSGVMCCSHAQFRRA